MGDDIEDCGVKPSEKKIAGPFVKDLVNLVSQDMSYSDIEREIVFLRRKYKIVLTKEEMADAYYSQDKQIDVLSRYLVTKAVRSASGVLVETIVLRPDVFSCTKQCSYCPTETDLSGKPTQPKSYISTEPAMLRALEYDFDVLGQLWDRIHAYTRTGNLQMQAGVSHKLEIIVSGGTWEMYPYDYRNQVMQEIYWAANVYDGKLFIRGNKAEMHASVRPARTLEEEIQENETASFRVIGLTLETRPDCITRQSLTDYRRWGVTRMQIGVQHYDDEILETLQRDCYYDDTVRAIRLLKQCGFKVVCHLMPDLPGSSPEKDQAMFEKSIADTDVFFDDVKIYPHVIPRSSLPDRRVHTPIAKLYADGLYTPYSETDLQKLIDVLIYYKMRVPVWVRIQRLIRDIPAVSIEAGYKKKANLRQMIQDEMKKRLGAECQCIRCREIGRVKDGRVEEYLVKHKPHLVVRSYEASHGLEYHITYETYRKTWRMWLSLLWYWMTCWIGWLGLFIGRYYFGDSAMNIFNPQWIWWSGNVSSYDRVVGFCRMRIDPFPGGTKLTWQPTYNKITRHLSRGDWECIDNNRTIIPELKDCALVRELHVYGETRGIKNANGKSGRSQHCGYGSRMLQVAEEIARQYGFKRIAIIAGVGTREYYRKKCGYELCGTYMIKNI